MTIHFYHDSNQEMINGITNPIGTLLITFINETNFDSKLLNQKDTNFMYRVYLACCQLFVDDIMEIINSKNTKELSKQKLTLTITFDDNKTIDFTLSYSEFEQLVSLVTYIKLFIELNIKNENKPMFFMYYFNTFLSYQIPKYRVLNNTILKESNIQLLNLHRSNGKNIDANTLYNMLKDNTLVLLKDLKESSKTKKSNFIIEYECNNLIDILLSSLHYIYNNNINIKKCSNCGRLFIPKSNSQKCCNNIRPKLENENDESYENVTETCSQYNTRYQSIKHMAPIDLAKRKVKQRIQKRIREKKEKSSYLQEWEKDVKNKRDFFPDDTKYIKWILEKSDEHQKGGKRTNGSTRNNKK